MVEEPHNPTIDYEERGREAQNRNPVVLVHGFPFDHTIWQQQLDDLGKDFWVIAPDLPGFGGSSPIENVKPTIEDYADRLSLWVYERGLGTVVLVGHSMGGYIALAFAHKYPEMLAGLGLACTRAGADTDAARETRYTQIAQVWEQGSKVVADAMLPRLFSQATRDKHPEIVDNVNELMLRQSPEGVVAALQAMAGRPDTTSTLGRIRVPTLVVSGADDMIIPVQDVDLLAAMIEGAARVVIDSAGHMPMLEQPSRLSSALADLARGAQTMPDMPQPPAPGEIEGVRTHE